MKYTLIALCSFLFISSGIAQTFNNSFAIQYTATGDGGNGSGEGITCDALGNIYTTGNILDTFNFNSAGSQIAIPISRDFYITKHNSTGALVWVKTIGGIGEDQSYSIISDNNNNIYVAGYFVETVDFDPNSGVNTQVSMNGTKDGFIIKLDSNGNLIWINTITSPFGDETVFSLALDPSNNLYATGIFNNTADFDMGTATYNLTPSGLQDAFIVKYNTSGNFMWAKNIGGSTSTTTIESNKINVNSNNRIIVTGNFIETIDFDPSGATANNTSLGLNDVFISCYDLNGNYVWAKTFGGSNSDISRESTTDNNDNIILTGYFIGTSDFDPSPSNTANSTSSSRDIFIVKLDSIGNFIWVKTLGSTNFDEGRRVATDNYNNIIVAGNFRYTVDFDPSTSTNLISSVNNTYDIFIEKFDPQGNYLNILAIGGTKSETPNGLFIDINDNIFTTGAFGDTVNFNPNGSPLNLISNSLGNSNIFVAKYVNINTSTSNSIKDSNKISVYPNPANNIIHVLTNQNIKSQASYKLIDTRGVHLLNKEKCSSENLSIDISSLKPGVYFIELTIDNTVSYSKFVKQ